MNELKPCPNCGLSPILRTKNKKFYYECSECWTATKKHWLLKDAQTEWNNLKADAPANQTILQALLEKHPNIKINSNGIPDNCPDYYGFHNFEECNFGKDQRICLMCWEQKGQ